MRRACYHHQVNKLLNNRVLKRLNKYKYLTLDKCTIWNLNQPSLICLCQHLLNSFLICKVFSRKTCLCIDLFNIVKKEYLLCGCNRQQWKKQFVIYINLGALNFQRSIFSCLIWTVFDQEYSVVDCLSKALLRYINPCISVWFKLSLSRIAWH